MSDKDDNNETTETTEAVEVSNSKENSDLNIKDKKRIIYARKLGEKGDDFSVEDGEPISTEMASELKEICWGGADRPLKPIWQKGGIVFNPADKMFAYGLKLPKNDTKNFLMCLQAYFIKVLLFQEEKQSKKSGAGARRYRKGKDDKDNKSDEAAVAKKMKPSKEVQVKMFIDGLVEVLFKAAGGKDAIVCLPGEKACFDPPAQFLNDNVTEKLRLFTCETPEDMKNILGCFTDKFLAADGKGVLCCLYSLVISRKGERVMEDLQDQAGQSLINTETGECKQALLNLVITGKATPYVHNSTATMDDGQERTGICGRNDIGFLISSENAQSSQVGAYLKTPTLPMWVSKCDGQLGVLFNPNKDLLRTRGAENKFTLFYYSNYEFGKTETPKETLLTIDSRAKKQAEVDKDFDHPGVGKDVPLLETAIKTKWVEASVDWGSIEPYICQYPRA